MIFFNHFGYVLEKYISKKCDPHTETVCNSKWGEFFIAHIPYEEG
jgi:hypothetical protein